MGVPGVGWGEVEGGCLDGEGRVEWGCLGMGWGEVAWGCLGWGGTG